MPPPSPSPPPLQLTPLATLSPPSPSRAWLTAPHPSLPLLATCSADKSVRIYSLTSFTLLSTIAGGHKRSIRSAAWKPNLKGESVLATGSFDASVGIWRRWDGGMMPKPKDVLTGVDFDARDREIGIGENKEDEENNVGEEEDDEEWRFAIVLDGHDSEVKSVAWSAGGNLLATCSRDKSVWVWEEVGEDDFETVAVMQDHEGDVKCVAWHPEEELLASASYDDEVRLWREDVDDWGCCAVLRGHGGTVWGVVWEGGELGAFARGVGVGVGEREEREEWVKRRELAGPRLASCSDDGSVRIWRRCPRERVLQSRLSIIKSGSAEEEWVQEAQLPRVHKRPVYAIAWGRKGRVVSTGGDGAVVVYEERWRRGDGGVGSMTTESKATEASGDGVDGAGINGEGGEDGVESMEGGMKESASSERVIGQDQKEMEEVREATEWVVVAQIEAAHGAFEVNHVAWATRRDKKAGRGGDGELEEVIVTTGDDGAVKVWCLE